MKGFAIEKRDRDDASISVGKWRIRLPQWMFWVLIAGIVSFTIIQVVSLIETGKPVPVRGVIGEGAEPK